MRRFVVSVLMVLMFLPLGVVSATQDATPGAGLAAYPEVAVTVTDYEIQVANDQVPAGYIRLAVTNNSQEENGVGLLAVPAGESFDVMSQATPEAGNFIPPFFYSTTVAGGPTSIPPGETWSQVVHVDPGQWVVFAQNDQQPATVTVAETDATVTATPTADATITESDFAFAGFDQLTAGEQVVEVLNEGEQPHMLDFFQIPDGTTMEQVEAALSAPDDATPAPGGLQESDIMLVSGGQVLIQSTGTSVWMDVDLAEGTYVAVCFIVDPETGMPHAMEGMVSLFEVSGAEAATPVS